MIRRVNPIAKFILQSRRSMSTLVIPNKKKYNSKKERQKNNAIKSEYNKDFSKETTKE